MRSEQTPGVRALNAKRAMELKELGYTNQEIAHQLAVEVGRPIDYTVSGVNTALRKYRRQQASQ